MRQVLRINPRFASKLHGLLLHCNCLTTTLTLTPTGGIRGYIVKRRCIDGTRQLGFIAPHISAHSQGIDHSTPRFARPRSQSILAETGLEKGYIVPNAALGINGFNDAVCVTHNSVFETVCWRFSKSCTPGRRMIHIELMDGWQRSTKLEVT